ncbi:unnamed protein product [Ambrosiozyma monospora]|uniref:Unnamed protein product n=1 Tax=Ambrosiozyma monospora TaxID=43982 RepID=A0ACB5SRV5_AMBMO|nr:unnamed protein product [Ambrosiozyma monospora]
MSASEDGSVYLGKIIYIAVKPIFKIYLIIGVGFWLARKNILTVDASRTLSTIILLVLLPCLQFTKVVTNISNSDIGQIGTIAIISVFMMLGEAMLVFLVGVMLGCPRNWWGGLIACGLLPNIGDIPISYLQGLEDSNVFSDVDKGVSYVFIYCAFQNLVQFNLGGFRLIEMDFKHELKNKDRYKDDLEMAKEDLPNSDEQKGENSDDLTVQMPQDQVVSHPNVEIDVASSISSNTGSIRTQNTENNNTTTDLRAHALASDGDTSRSQQNPLSRITSAVSSILQPNDDALSRSMFIDNHSVTGPAEDVNDIVRVYSRYDQLSKKASINQKTTVPSSDVDDEERKKSTFNILINRIKKALTFKKLKATFLTFVRSISESMLHPLSLSLVVSITACMIPWVKALFVNNKQAHLSPAPDGLPPLSFIMDFTSYIGAAQVPFGLLLLGGTIGRLKVNKLPKGLWKTPVSLTIIKLFVFPVIGCALNSKIHKDGLFHNEDILYFLSNINFCLPPATSLLYLTAMYTPVGKQDTIQMNCLALTYIFHYICLVVCLPFTTSYTMKVSLGY